MKKLVPVNCAYNERFTRGATHSDEYSTSNPFEILKNVPNLEFISTREKLVAAVAKELERVEKQSGFEKKTDLILKALLEFDADGKLIGVTHPHARVYDTNRVLVYYNINLPMYDGIQEVKNSFNSSMGHSGDLCLQAYVFASYINTKYRAFTNRNLYELNLIGKTFEQVAKYFADSWVWQRPTAGAQTKYKMATRKAPSIPRSNGKSFYIRDMVRDYCIADIDIPLKDLPTVQKFIRCAAVDSGRLVNEHVGIASDNVAQAVAERDAAIRTHMKYAGEVSNLADTLGSAAEPEQEQDIRSQLIALCDEWAAAVK